jgi:hypothetical protein
MACTGENVRLTPEKRDGRRRRRRDGTQDSAAIGLGERRRRQCGLSAPPGVAVPRAARTTSVTIYTRKRRFVLQTRNHILAVQSRGEEG